MKIGNATVVCDYCQSSLRAPAVQFYVSEITGATLCLCEHHLTRWEPISLTKVSEDELLAHVIACALAGEPTGVTLEGA